MCAPNLCRTKSDCPAAARHRQSVTVAQGGRSVPHNIVHPPRRQARKCAEGPHFRIPDSLRPCVVLRWPERRHLRRLPHTQARRCNSMGKPALPHGKRATTLDAAPCTMRLRRRRPTRRGSVSQRLLQHHPGRPSPQPGPRPARGRNHAVPASPFRGNTWSGRRAHQCMHRRLRRPRQPCMPCPPQRARMISMANPSGAATPTASRQVTVSSWHPQPRQPG